MADLGAKQVISTSTLIPIGLAFTLAGGVWWAADTNARLRQNTEFIAGMGSDIKEIKSDVAAIRERIGPGNTGISKLRQYEPPRAPSL